MFAFRSVPRVKEDDPITVDDRNMLASEIEKRDIIPGPGILVSQTESGVVVSTASSDRVKHAKTGGTGIAVASSATQMTSGTVNIWTADLSGALVDTGISITAWNKDTSSAVGSNKHVMITLSDDGLWIVTWEQC